MTTVWVVQTGESRHIVDVFDSLESAVTGVKASYAVVKWADLLPVGDDFYLEGTFERVKGYPPGYVGRFDFTPYELRTA